MAHEKQPLYEFARKTFRELRPSGANDVLVICPFHTRNGAPERTGSLNFSVRDGRWYCHGCGEGGGFRRLLRKLGYTHEEIDEALLEELYASIPEKPQLSLWPGIAQEHQILPEAVMGLFDTGNKIPAEAKKWGFSGNTIRAFEVGYDRRNLRITFPLRDRVGHLVGFSGRALGEQRARYKVYGETEYQKWGITGYGPYEKGNLLWNLDRVEPALERIHNAPILVTEGFKACMWLWQLGYRNTIALLGSSMTEVQQRLLESLGGSLYLFLDNDETGRLKKPLIAQRLYRSGCSVFLPNYPTLQPDSLTREQLEESLRNAVYYTDQQKEDT